MSNRIDLSYFAYGNRNFDCLKNTSKIIQPSASVKSSASNLIERNYLDFDPGIIKNNYSFAFSYNDNKNSINSNNKKFNFNRSSSEPNFEVNPEIFNKYHPEYKLYRNTNEQIKELNNYLSPVGQYLFKDNPKIKTVEKLFSLQKSRKNMLAEQEENNKYSSPASSKNENINNISSSQQKIILKNPVNTNILIPNDFHLKNNSFLPKMQYKDNNINNFKYNSFLESKQAPEYLRNYDKESLRNIDQYYINKNENVHILSKFGNWITLKPNDKNRKHALEKIKHGTNETSILAPIWMDITSRRNNINNNNDIAKKTFKCCQYGNSVRDNTKVTLLIDRDQKNVKPLFLRDTFEKNNILLNQTNN